MFEAQEGELVFSIAQGSGMNQRYVQIMRKPQKTTPPTPPKNTSFTGSNIAGSFKMATFHAKILNWNMDQLRDEGLEEV